MPNMLIQVSFCDCFKVEKIKCLGRVFWQSWTAQLFLNMANNLKCCLAASLLSLRMLLIRKSLFHLLTDSLFICSPWMFIGWHQHLNPNHCWRCSGWLDSHCSDRLRDWSKKDLCWISDSLNPVCNLSWNITGFPSLVLGFHVHV